MIIVDSHCHLDMLTHDSIDRIIARAHDGGVHYLQTICTKLDNFAATLAIATKHDNVFTSVGIHPSAVQSVTPAAILLDLCDNHKVIGIGETGLDYFYNTAPDQHQLQRESLQQHIITAQQNQLPVIIHTRNAENDTLAIIDDYKRQKDFSGLIHCFTASKDFAMQVLDQGIYISVSGIITFKNSESLREVIQYIPLDKLLIETDSPYLAPVPHRGQTNEPSYLPHVLQCLAHIKQISPQEAAQATTDNFFRLFQKAKR